MPIRPGSRGVIDVGVLASRPHAPPLRRSEFACAALAELRPLELAERGGFEPPEEFPLHMISSHADSAWLSHLSLMLGGAGGNAPPRPLVAPRRSESGAPLLRAYGLRYRKRGPPTT